MIDRYIAEALGRRIWGGSIENYANPHWFYGNPKGAGMKVQVTRTKLIAALTAKSNELKAEIAATTDTKAMVAKYEKDVAEYCKQLNERVIALKPASTPQQLDAIVEKLVRSQEFQNYSPNMPKVIHDHYKENDLKQLTSAIKALSLSDQETVEMADDSDYMRFL